MTLAGRFYPLSESNYISTLHEMRDQYRSNAEHAISAGELRKASELLWCAVTQQLKALAVSYGIQISSHRQFFDFLRQLAGELDDESLYKEFVDLNALHRNFYDETIPPDVFPDFYARSVRFIERLDILATKGRE